MSPLFHLMLLLFQSSGLGVQSSSIADLSVFVGDGYFIFATFPCGILGQVWNLIVSFSDLCRFSYFFPRMDINQNHGGT